MRTRLLASLVLVAIVAATLAAGGKMNYVYKRGDTSYMRTDGDSIRALKRATQKYGSEFIWVRQDGRSWVISNASVLASARELFREMEIKSKPLQEVEARLRPYEKEMESVERRMDALSDKLDDEDLSDSDRNSIEERVRKAEEQVRATESQMRVVEKELERLEKELEKMEEAIEGKFEQLVEKAIREGKAERLD